MVFKFLALRPRGSAVFLMPVAAALVLCTVGGVRVLNTNQRARNRNGATNGCQIREYLHHEAEVPGCKPQILPVRGCFGKCQTYEVPILLPPHKVASHKMCSFGEVEWRTVELSDCEPGVNRNYSYYNAVRCRCRRCDSSDTYCAGM